MELGQLITEQRNENTMNIDKLDISGILKLINEEDKKVAYCVEKAIPDISKAVELVVEAFNKGGRLIYVGAGTSGRLAIVDASECPPTFGVHFDMVVGIIAGEDSAIRTPIENVEDNEEQGRIDIRNLNCCEKDVVMGIAASGRTPYVIGALKEARKLGAKTTSLANNPNSATGVFRDSAEEYLNKAGNSKRMQ